MQNGAQSRYVNRDLFAYAKPKHRQHINVNIIQAC